MTNYNVLQILGREFISSVSNGYNAYVTIPDIDSLDKKYANEYVDNAFNNICEEKITFKLTIKGEEP